MRGFDGNPDRVDDGFNDVAWASLSQYEQLLGVGVVLGITSLRFIGTDIITTEVDIQLNRDISPWAYFTDGKHQIDLEQELLRLEGFALGLDVSFDPQSVMYSGPEDRTSLPIIRTLGAADKATVASLYPKRPSLLVDTVSLAKDSAIVAEGYAEPGAFNAQGDFAFVTNVSSGQALIVSSADGTQREVVRSGTNFAGIPLRDGSLGAVGLNDAGDVAFCWLAGPFELPFGVNGGLFRANRKGSQEAVMLPGVTPAPGGGVFAGCFTTTISNEGDIAFTGLVQRGAEPVEHGAFVARRDGTITRIAANGDPAPGGGVFSGVFFARISPNGRNVAFDALTGDDAQNYGVYVWRGHGKVEAIARPGDLAAGGGAIVSAIRPRVNSRGDVLYGAQIPGATGPTGEFLWSLFLADKDGRSQAIARYGDPLADGFLFNGLAVSANSWTLNDAGDIGFVASATRINLPSEDPTLAYGEEGVYTTSHGKPGVVGRTGSFVAGKEEIVSLAQVVNPSALINARGDVVFQADLGFFSTTVVTLRASPN